MFGKRMESPKGMRVVVAAGNVAQPELLPKAHDDIRIERLSRWNRRYRCGHRDARRFMLDVYGQRVSMKSKKELCSTCWCAKIRQHVIRCAACGLPIFPGEGVALYAFDPELFSREKVTFVGESVIGCTRWDCCPSGGFFAGNWTESGFRPRFDGNNTAAEQCATETD